MLEEVSRALNELAAIIARLQFIEAELMRAKDSRRSRSSGRAT